MAFFSSYSVFGCMASAEGVSEVPLGTDSMAMETDGSAAPLSDWMSSFFDTAAAAATAVASLADYSVNTKVRDGCSKRGFSQGPPIG